MTEPITNNYDAMTEAAARAETGLPAPAPGGPPRPGVHPLVLAAVDDSAAANRRAGERVRDGLGRTDKYTRGLKDLQSEGADGLRGLGASPVSQMPAGTAAAPAPAPAAAPVSAPAPMPPVDLPPPAGVTMINPGLLAALVAATAERAQSDAADGIVPGLGGAAASPRSATTPQPSQPLDRSQVSFEKYPGGQLSPQQTAAVIDQALTINGVPNDPNLRAQWQQLYQHMAGGESGRNPNAVNLSDSNATGPRQADGAPANSSRGMWQCIPSTFAAYHMAGTSTSIYDPVASAAASINYVMHRYHVSPTGEGLASFAAARGVGRGTYTGY